MAVLVISSCSLFKSAEDLFSDAEQKRNMGEAKGALELLQIIVDKHMEHEIAPDAQYLIAEIYYRDMRDFTTAIKQYGNLRIKFPESKQVPFSLFMQGLFTLTCWPTLTRQRNIILNFLKNILTMN